MTGSFPALVEKELATARELHRPHQSIHESASVIREEFEEFWDAVKLDRDTPKLLHELIQTAAMCQRAAEDLGMLK